VDLWVKSRWALDFALTFTRFQPLLSSSLLVSAFKNNISNELVYALLLRLSAAAKFRKLCGCDAQMRVLLHFVSCAGHDASTKTYVRLQNHTLLIPTNRS
jgi:hypothetical protein